MSEYRYILTYDGDSETLTINPESWDNLKVVFQRNKFYHSILRSFALPLRFPVLEGGGGQFIIDAYQAEGLEAVVEIDISKRNPQTDDYDEYY